MAPIIDDGTNATISSTSAATKGTVEVSYGLKVYEATGSVLLGKSAPAHDATGGFPYIPVVAAAPDGTPTARTGFVPIVFCSADSKLYVYSGAAWIKTGALS